MIRDVLFSLVRLFPPPLSSATSLRRITNLTSRTGISPGPTAPSHFVELPTMTSTSFAASRNGTKRTLGSRRPFCRVSFGSYKP